MSISTKRVDLTTSSRSTKREKINNLFRYHKDLFQKERQNNPKFIPRICYLYKGEKVIGLYPREIYGGKDIYIEFVNRDYVPQDPDRILWKWVYNPEVETEYAKSEPHPVSGDRMFLIPIEELINVSRYHNPKLEDSDIKPLLDLTPKPKEETTSKKAKEEDDEKEFTLDLGDDVAGADIPYQDMTMRDYAAIQWKKPVSHKKWLNELINKTFNNE